MVSVPLRGCVVSILPKIRQEINTISPSHHEDTLFPINPYNPTMIFGFPSPYGDKLFLVGASQQAGISGFPSPYGDKLFQVI